MKQMTGLERTRFAVGDELARVVYYHECRMHGDALPKRRGAVQGLAEVGTQGTGHFD